MPSLFRSISLQGALLCILFVGGSMAQFSFFNIECYTCADCEHVSRSTPKCTSPTQNPLTSHSIGYTFPDQGQAKSCIKVRDENGIYHRGCHNTVNAGCVYVEGVEVCYCTGHLCNSARRPSSSLQLVSIMLPPVTILFARMML